MDLHVSQLQGFYPETINLDNLHSFPTLADYLVKGNEEMDLRELVVLSPDAGGVKRAENFASRIKSRYPIAFIDKRKDFETGEIKYVRLSGDVKGKDVIVVDDIIDSGNTIIESVKLLKKQGANKLFCYGTHGLFTVKENRKKIYNLFERVITSNTHYQEDDALEVLDVSPVFAEAIYRAHMGMSISKLFE